MRYPSVGALTVAAGLLYVHGCAATSRTGRPDVQAPAQSTPFGNVATGESAQLFSFRNARGIEVQVTNYGGIITSIRTPDRAGRFADIVLGYGDLAGYLRDSPYFGAIVGRYANRIARGRFTL
ncbi:MAG: galactose-1-epimerase, partial [Gemmatimonadota bacterium]|nr:galactose-1-epimerase [Gemmatimonadota bacterium]